MALLTINWNLAEPPIFTKPVEATAFFFSQQMCYKLQQSMIVKNTNIESVSPNIQDVNI